MVRREDLEAVGGLEAAVMVEVATVTVAMVMAAAALVVAVMEGEGTVAKAVGVWVRCTLPLHH